MYRKFQIRKTFMLNSDLNETDVVNENSCEVFYTNIKYKDTMDMSPQELFIALAEEIKKKDFDPSCKYLAVLSFTRYYQNEDHVRDIFKSTKAYCALGLTTLINSFISACFLNYENF